MENAQCIYCNAEFKKISNKNYNRISLNHGCSGKAINVKVYEAIQKIDHIPLTPHAMKTRYTKECDG
jgi:hypothetical protein